MWNDFKTSWPPEMKRVLLCHSDKETIAVGRWNRVSPWYEEPYRIVWSWTPDRCKAFSAEAEEKTPFTYWMYIPEFPED